MCFPYCGLQKTWINKSLQSQLSEDHSRSNMLRGTKRFGNLNDTIFNIFIDPCQGNSVGKILS